MVTLDATIARFQASADEALLMTWVPFASICRSISLCSCITSVFVILAEGGGGGGGGSLMRTGSSRRFVLRRSPLRVKLNSLSAVVITAGYIKTGSG